MAEAIRVALKEGLGGWKMTIDPLPDSAGTAHMLPDKTIVLDLVARHMGIVGDARFVHQFGTPDYDDILAYLGGLVPGDSKSVPPWPDRQL